MIQQYPQTSSYLLQQNPFDETTFFNVARRVFAWEDLKKIYLSQYGLLRDLYEKSEDSRECTSVDKNTKSRTRSQPMTLPR